MQTTVLPQRQEGFALFSVLLVFIVMASMAVGMLSLCNIDLKSSSQYKTGRQAFFGAESGLVHALSTINGRGVQDFRADIVTQWSGLFGTPTKAMQSDAMSGYTVAVAENTADPANRGSITATGFGPNEAAHLLIVRLKKGITADQGALYLANDNVNADFGARDQFEIDGNDHLLGGTLNPTGPLRPGISTRNDAVTNAVKGVLSDPQKEKVTGLGYTSNPLNPSVMTTSGPTVSNLEQIVNRILANTNEVSIGDRELSAGTYGTLDNPQVTHLTNQNVTLNGSMNGVGILIADGEFTINGSANFIGWIIVRGPTILQSGNNPDDTLADGNSVIRGSLWTGDLVVQVGGSAIVDYCAECMALVDRIGAGNNVPRVMAVTSWQEVL